MVASSFIDTVTRPIDGKGRVAIPAPFRKVLDAGDPEREPGEPASMMLVFGAHLKGCFRGYTVAAYEEAGRRIRAIEPRDATMLRRKEMALKMHFGSACRLEIESTGRVVLPAERRAQLGVGDGEVVFRGLGDYFEIWNAAAYAAEDSDLDAFLDEEPGFDPTALPFMLG